MKILVPTDFSKNAQRAAEYAVLLAKAFGTGLKLLHIYTPPVTRNNLSYPLIQEEITRAIKAASKQLHTLCQELSAGLEIPCESLVKEGEVVEEIINEAKTNKTDLLVMGTLGASGIKKIIFGTNTASVIEKAPCPVLAVPVNGPLTLPRKIVYATNYYHSDMRIFKSLIPLVKSLNAELMIVHVAKDKRKTDRDMIEEFSKKVAKETGYEQPFYYVMTHKDIRKGIYHFVDSAAADLLVLSTRKRRFFEKLFDASLAKQMALHARLPMLVYGAEESAQVPYDELF